MTHRSFELLIGHVLVSALVLVTSACGKKDDAKPQLASTRANTAAAEPAVSAAKPVEPAPAANEPATPDEPQFSDKDEASTKSMTFGFDQGKKRVELARGCFTNISDEWNIMVPLEGKDPCGADGEDDFALSLSFPGCKSGPTCKLPAPNETFEGTLMLEPSGYSNKVMVSVIEHK
ncbi:MAG TPA: hypothetical protein VK427_09790, partial [Kofleriaceae bacterium]|nr:hypothetical protein [Kofleriaceae bacterium]